MKICFLGLENLPVLAPEFSHHGIGGEQVQHTLLAKALARRGHNVSMVVLDYGQPDGAQWDQVTTYKSYRLASGIPVFRYIYPRWTSVWAALRRADADVYCVSCAGMHVGLLAMFCRKYKRKLIFKIAHDTDCDPDKLLIRYWRDKKLYEYGLRHVDHIIAQSRQQQQAMLDNYGYQSLVADMLVDVPDKVWERKMDVLWVNNIRQFKRPDLLLALAKKLPQYNFHMVAGRQPGFNDLFDQIRQQGAQLPNFTFHDQMPYHDIHGMFASARVFVNTSDSEGFPNAYLQCWIRGTPVVAFFDPDSVIQREGLGSKPGSLDQMAEVVKNLLENEAERAATGARCQAYMERTYGEERIMKPYLATFLGQSQAGA